MARLVRWNPWHEMEMMQRAAQSAARDGGSVYQDERVRALPVDAYTTDDEIVVTASVPGLNPDDLTINIEDDILTIRGETNGQPEDVNYSIRERYAGKFERRLRLTIPVDIAGAEAVFENGILTLTLPKAPEAKPQTITVKTK